MSSFSQFLSGQDGISSSGTHARRPSRIAIRLHVNPTIGMKPNFRYCRIWAPKATPTPNGPLIPAASRTQPCPEHSHVDLILIANSFGCGEVIMQSFFGYVAVSFRPSKGPLSSLATLPLPQVSKNEKEESPLQHTTPVGGRLGHFL